MEIKIRQSDTLWYYSQLFDVPLVLIEQSNRGITPQNLSIGKQIHIPGFVINQHTIEVNDTFWQLSSQYNVAMDALLLVNQTIDPSNLVVGSTISIPYRVQNLIVHDVTNYTYEKMVNDIEKLASVYPFLVEQTIGSSVMGKSLPELRIGNGVKRVHVDGSFHANEWITTSVIMKFVNEYLLALTNSNTIRGMNMLPLFMETFLSIVPMVNPDGVNLVLNGVPEDSFYAEQVLEINNQSRDFSGWKANINGVDLTNQYPTLWEIEASRKPSNPAPSDYPGPYPLSEPESSAVAELTSVRNFARVNALHTQGEVIYWGFEGLEPPISEVIVNEYARVSGYEPIQYVDSYTGYKDWFIQEYQRPGFTIELGSGTNPLPISQFDEIYEESLGIFLANLYL
ncbi:M14 family metallopeptidase [Virgibacillus necropolis]|uniref:Peptidase M14 n=1 Tax=Virgibacillus necropolis TaxID=163877 RepID=A0A221MD52_9BACI|nr:M14 family metallopeptidase [Virgibacillus necropolis]ASN05567.1 peptidase M14 [Virgibacillus necropolis]